MGGQWTVFGLVSQGREFACGFLRSSGFPARALRLASGDCGTEEVALGAVWLTRSREAAKGNVKASGRWAFFEYEYELGAELVFGFRFSVRRAADGSPRVVAFRSSGFPARALWFCV